MKRFIALFLCCFLFLCAACEKSSNEFNMPKLAESTAFLQNSFDRSTPDFSGVEFSEWDVSAAVRKVPARAIKPWTIMIYMNGSDLESEDGAATLDLIEMLNCGANSSLINIIVFTGGTNRWQNNVVPENTCALWEVANKKLYKIAEIGLVNMGNAGTLAGFIEFSTTAFPSNRFGLILWDHGGGSIAGYGHDEKFLNGTLTLLKLNCAFERAGLNEQKLEFLGLDSCLMATVEMAMVAQNYAKYLIASQDLEPGEGWDYSFLAAVNQNPELDGAQLGTIIAQSFVSFYGKNAELDLTLSVCDLSRIGYVMGNFALLLERCSTMLSQNYPLLALRRNATKTFGIGSARDNESDMVDLAHLCCTLYDLFPIETANLIAALSHCVVYNIHNSPYPLGGLSAYYIFGGKQTAQNSLQIYASLNMHPSVSNYLAAFYLQLRSNLYSSSPLSLTPASRNAQALWIQEKGGLSMRGISYDSSNLFPTLCGEFLPLYEVSISSSFALYACPVSLNNKDCDLMILISPKNPNGKILGVRNYDGYIMQKGYSDLKKGDKLRIYFKKSNSYVLSAPITLPSSPSLLWQSPPKNSVVCVLSKDAHNNEHFSNFKSTSRPVKAAPRKRATAAISLFAASHK